MGGSQTIVAVAGGAARPDQIQHGNQRIPNHFRRHALCTLGWRLGLMRLQQHAWMNKKKRAQKIPEMQ